MERLRRQLERLTLDGISTEEILETTNIEHRKDILRRIMMSKKTETFEILKSCCSAYEFPFAEYCLRYLDIILTTWEPEIVEPGRGKEPRYVRINSNQVNLLFEECKRVSDAITDKTAMKAYLTKALEVPLFNFYHYEVFLIAIYLAEDSIKTQWISHLRFLQTYTREADPTELETEAWLRSSKKPELPPIAKWRVAFLPKESFFDLLTPGLNLNINTGPNILANSKQLQAKKRRNDEGDTSTKRRKLGQSGKSTEAQSKSEEGAIEGRLYEKSSLALLAERGCEKYTDFSIGREVKIGNDAKLDDIVFKCGNDDGTKDLIFVQIKHKQNYSQIDSKSLSTDASIAKSKGGLEGGLCRDFNLQKYFMSYLSIRKGLQITECYNLKGGKIKYVVIFTNVGLNINDLEDEGFSMTNAPDDVVELFKLGELAVKPENYCQILDIGEDLKTVLKYSADLHKLAQELAKYSNSKAYNKNYMESGIEGPIKNYHVELVQKVIHKFWSTESKEWLGEFKKDFIENTDMPDPEKELRDAIFEAIKKLNSEYTDANDEELKEILSKAKWRLNKNFGNAKRAGGASLKPWENLNEQDITEFLEKLVFIVNQPKVEQLHLLLNSSTPHTVLEGTGLRSLLDSIQNTGPEFRERMLNKLGIGQKNNFKEKWIPHCDIRGFVEELKQQILVSFMGTAMHLLYENEVMQYCQFQNLGTLKDILNDFLQNSKQKILWVNTPNTLLSSIKVLQHLKANYLVESRISVGSEKLKTAENIKAVEEIFRLNQSNLLTLECEDQTENVDVQKLHDTLSSIIENNSKKIILIAKQGNSLVNTFANEYKVGIDKIGSVSDLTDKSRSKILEKEVIFQGNKISLNKLINKNTAEQMNIETLVEIIKNEEIKIGSNNAETSDLAGAYAQLYQDINIGRLINNLLYQENIFVISGINGPEKSKRFIQKLKAFRTGLPVDIIKQNQWMSDFSPDTKHHTRILLDDNKFQDKNFKQLCRTHSDKKIYWISTNNDSENASQFLLQQIYNPDFYVDRQFNYLKKVIIKGNICKALRLMSEDMFLFTYVDNQGDTSLKFLDSVLITQQSNGQEQFDSLVVEYSTKSVHWLHIEQNTGNIVWIKSHGKLDTLRKYIDHTKRIEPSSEKEFINDIKNTQVVIIADDPGMGKTTSFTKLCTLPYGSGPEASSMFSSHWIINVNLKDHIPTISQIDSSNIGIQDIVELCSAVDSNLVSHFAQYILRYAFENQSFIKPLLIKFDGFDEVLDENIREKIIALMQFLRKSPRVKIWITTRRHCEQTLENALLTFAAKIEPLDNLQNKKFIYKFLKDRLDLTLSENQLNYIFGDTFDKVREKTNKIAIYAEAFLKKMKDIFEGDNAKFIGTPLQLCLMLEGSIKYFKKWIESDNNLQSLNFEYLGDNMLSVFEKFINDKYAIYFKKEDVKGQWRHEYNKAILDQHHQNFAKSLIFDSERKMSLKEFRDIYLSAGIIIYHGSDIEFIHPTFREYFAAKVFMHWIEKWSPNLANTNKQKYLLSEILMKPDYRVIRTFINLHLTKFMQNNIQFPPKTIKWYGGLIDILWRNPENLYVKGQSILYLAVTEGNMHVANFILESAQYSERVLLDFLTNQESEMVEGNVFWFAITQAVAQQLQTIGRDHIAQKEYNNFIEKCFAITNGKPKIQKAMLLATLFRRYRDHKIGKHIFHYIHTKYPNNHLLNLLNDKAKKSPTFNAILKEDCDVDGLDVEVLSSQIEDEDVMSALSNITKFTYDEYIDECLFLHYKNHRLCFIEN